MRSKIMAYKKENILKESLELIEKHHLIFIDDIVGLLPCSKQTFYVFFPPESDELDKIKSSLEKNRISMKANMRKKWYQSENATLQVALMKLIATDDEAARLSGVPKEQKQKEDALTIKWNQLDAN
jgi:hypothetical protein